jgi:hypothetical protein
MKAIVVLFAILAIQFTQTSCSVKLMRPFSPLTEQERQNLGTIGIVAEVATLDARYKQDVQPGGVGLSDIRDRVTGTGEGVSSP